MDYQKLADMLFPNIDKTPQFYDALYKERKLKDRAEVVRFAPSPTGFLHIGGVRTALVSYLIAKKTSGINYLRLEDTDLERTVSGAKELCINGLNYFGIYYDEGATVDGEKGSYGPYTQTERREIYQTLVKSLVSKGLAYPCFCSEKDDKERKKNQEDDKAPKWGYYGKYARCRNLSIEAIENNLKANKPFGIRLKVNVKEGERFRFRDLVKGDIEMDLNVNDPVILKQNGLPPYNLAHAVDDHYMGTTTVVRGEDWLSATSEHAQIFDALGFERIPYAHLSQIEKQDENTRRKLSKRKDPEADVHLLNKEGFPKEGVVDYLMILLNSDFEPWRKTNPRASVLEFDFNIHQMSKSGALFDLVKLADVSKNAISNLTAEEVYISAYQWAKEFDVELAMLLDNHKEDAIAMFSIDRGGNKPRKDIAKFSEIKQFYGYIFDEVFNKFTIADYELEEGKYSKELIRTVAEHYANIYQDGCSKDEWFAAIKEHIAEIGFAPDMGEYKKAPDEYKGSIADYTGIIRLIVTGKKNTPDLYYILKILGKQKMIARFTRFLNLMK